MMILAMGEGGCRNNNKSSSPNHKSSRTFVVPSSFLSPSFIPPSVLLSSFLCLPLLMSPSFMQYYDQFVPALKQVIILAGVKAFLRLHSFFLLFLLLIHSLFVSQYYDQFMPPLKQIIILAGAKEQRTLRARALECFTLVGLAVCKEMQDDEEEEEEEQPQEENGLILLPSFLPSSFLPSSFLHLFFPLSSVPRSRFLPKRSERNKSVVVLFGPSFLPSFLCSCLPIPCSS